MPRCKGVILLMAMLAAALVILLFELKHGFAAVDIASEHNLRIEQCCDACQAHAADGCTTWSWTSDQNGTCWLKRGKTDAIAKHCTTSDVAARTQSARPKATMNGISTFNWCGSRRKWIALTYDDIFNQPQLDHLLRDLRAFNLTATFFVVTMDSPGICNDIQHILADGHTIENHSNTHEHFTQINETTRLDEIKRVETMLYDRCAIATNTMTQFRPPYLEFSRALADEVNALGYTISATNVDSRDWTDTDLNTTWETVLSGFARLPANSSAVVLHHNWTYKPKGTEGILARYVEHFGALGYRFVTSRECFAACLADNDCVMPGTTAYSM